MTTLRNPELGEPGIDRTSSPEISEELRRMAEELRSMQSGVFPPSGLLLRTVAVALESAAGEIEERRYKSEAYWAHEKTKRELDAMELERDELLAELERSDDRCCELRAAMEAAGVEIPGQLHRGVDWAALRMAHRAAQS